MPVEAENRQLLERILKLEREKEEERQRRQAAELETKQEVQHRQVAAPTSCRATADAVFLSPAARISREGTVQKIQN